MKVSLNRAMCFGGARQEVGATIELPNPLARELISQGRASLADGEAKPKASGPMTTETAGSLLGESAKGKK